MCRTTGNMSTSNITMSIVRSLTWITLAKVLYNFKLACFRPSNSFPPINVVHPVPFLLLIPKFCYVFNKILIFPFRFNVSWDINMSNNTMSINIQFIRYYNFIIGSQFNRII